MAFRCVVVGTELTQDAGRVRDYDADVAERAAHHASDWKDEPLTDSQQYALTGQVQRRIFTRSAQPLQ